MGARLFRYALLLLVGLTVLSASSALADSITFDWSNGGTDTTVFSQWPDRSYGSESILYADKKDKFDGSKTYGETQFLITFDDIIGNNPGQIPLGSTITNAMLRFYVYSGSNNQIDAYRMTAGWDGNSTWNSLSGGITPGADTVATPDATYQSKDRNTFFGIDVATSLQAWANGEVNLGWGFIDQGTDGVDYASFDHANLSYRPTLSVEFIAPVGGVPEPGTLLLATSGLLGGLAAYRRRRRRN